MFKVTDLFARQILDSKADPVVEVELTLSGGFVGIDSNPSGASTGAAESIDLRDDDPDWYAGRGVTKAVVNVNTTIKDQVLDREFSSQADFDTYLNSLDGTPTKRLLGANAILPVSLAFARASAQAQNQKLYQYLNSISQSSSPAMPRPAVLLMEGGKHGAWATDIQEFMLLPQLGAFPSFSHELHALISIFRELGQVLDRKGYSTGVGFEGAYCPHELTSNEQAFDLILQAVNQAGFSAPNHFMLCIDVAASEFFQEGAYVLQSEANQTYDSTSWMEKIVYWAQKYPIFSIEDPFDQNQWADWSALTARIGQTHQIVGDDLVVTNVERIQRAISTNACNAMIIKPNQIGTVSETLSAISLAKSAGMQTIISHRAGETSDSFIADLAVGTASQQCKFGGPNRGERLAKYNRLLVIESQI